MGIIEFGPLLIPRGLASLLDAKRWESDLQKAREALDSLALQESIFELEQLCAVPDIEMWLLAKNLDTGGISLTGMVSLAGQSMNLDTALFSMFMGTVERIGPIGVGAEWEQAVVAARSIEAKAKQRPEMLIECSLLDANSKWQPLVLNSKSSAQAIAEILGAQAAWSKMEKALLSKETRHTDRSQEPLRI